MISAPFQNNLQILENGSVLNALLIEPVIPFRLNSDWNLVTRTIVPVLALSSLPPQFDKWGLGDIQQGFFLHPTTPPAEESSGVRVQSCPTRRHPTPFTARASGVPGLAWSVSPMRGPWVFGALFNNLWSFAGDGDRSRVSIMTFQPFVNYNFDGGWFLQSAPLVTAESTAPSGEKWIVPVGGGGGRTFRIGTQPVTALLSTFYNVERPTGGPEWNIRFQLTFMFPR